MSKRIVRTASLFAGMVLLTACATSPQARLADLRPLQLALTTAPEVLRERAERNDASAQLGLSLLYHHGRGVERDPVEAERLLKAAVTSRGSTPITTYIAGLNGKPGRVSTIFVPRHDVTTSQAVYNFACARALAKGERTPQAAAPCGGEAAYDLLEDRWRR